MNTVTFTNKTYIQRLRRRPMSKRAEAREEGLTALHVAAHNGALDCLELLIAKGAAAINHNCAPPAVALPTRPPAMCLPSTV
jgi:ankyrin repeat protein